MDEPEQKPKITAWLVFSIVVCAAGNSLLYGYNIGVLNSPSCSMAYSLEERENIPNSQDVIRSNKSAKLDITKANISQWQQNSSSDEESNMNITGRYVDSLIVSFYVFFGIFGAVLSSRIGHYFAYSSGGHLSGSLFSFFVYIKPPFWILDFEGGNFRVDIYIASKKGPLLIVPFVYLASILGVVSTLIKLPELALASRALAGFHGGMSVNLASMYVNAISPIEYKGFGERIHQLFIAIGFILSVVLGIFQRTGCFDLWWFWLRISFTAITAFAFSLVFPCCPESPVTLICKYNDEESAKKVLVKLRGNLDVEEELEEIKIKARLSYLLEHFTLKQLMMKPEFKTPIIAVVSLLISQQMSGPIIIMCYSHMIFAQAGIQDVHIPFVNVGLGACLFLGILISRTGSKTSLIVKCVMMVSALILVFTLHQIPTKNEGNISTLTVIAVPVVFLYMGCYPTAFGFGTIPKFVQDTFPVTAHKAVTSIVHIISGLCSTAFLLGFPFIKASLHAYTYLIFVAALLVSILTTSLMHHREKKQHSENRTGVEYMDSLLDENKRLKEVLFCNRCNKKTKSIMYNQCGHILFCSSCDISVYSKRCPECNEEIKPYTHVKFHPSA